MKILYGVLDRLFEVVLVILVAGMILCVSSEIILRELVQPLTELLGLGAVWINQLSAPVNTLSEKLLVTIGILGSAYALKKNAHLGVDAFVRLYPRKVQVAAEYVSLILIGLFSVFVLIMGGIHLCLRFSGNSVPGLEFLSFAWLYAVLPAAGILNLLYLPWLFVHPNLVDTAETATEGAE